MIVSLSSLTDLSIAERCGEDDSKERVSSTRPQEQYIKVTGDKGSPTAPGSKNSLTETLTKVTLIRE